MRVGEGVSSGPVTRQKRLKTLPFPVADPGFPRGGGTNSPGGGGRQHTILPNFSKNCMKLKEFGSPGGARVPRAPLRSATVSTYYLCGR